MRVKNTAIGLFLGLLIQANLSMAQSTYQLEAFVAHYEARKLGMKLGILRLHLTKIGPQSYKFEAHSQTAGLLSLFNKDKIIERSYWQWHQQQVRPMKYWFSQTGRKKRQISVQFQWENQTAVKNVNGNIETLPFQQAVHDRLSYQIALMNALNRGQTQFEYPVMERKGFKIYAFNVLKVETLSTALGKLETIKIERVRKKSNNKRSTVFWCAKILAYLPVRIQHTEKNGSKFNMYINKLEGPLSHRLLSDNANINHQVSK